MKNYSNNIRTGRLVLLFIGVWIGITSLLLCTRLMNWSSKSTETIENSMLTRRICSRHRKILYGIFTVPNKIETRAVLRQQAQCGFDNEMHQVVFVVGMPETDTDYETITTELKTYNDIFVLSCKENMNYGKSYTYFKEALEKLPCFDFYAKVDDDTAFNPVKLSKKIAGIPNNTPLFIGRNSKNLDLNPCSDMIRSIIFLRDMSWLYQVEFYTAGMLYILNVKAVRLWVGLNPVDMYGDEDYRTSYYMIKIGARVVNLGEAFHDYIKYNNNIFRDHWRLDITNNSLVVHKCKSKTDLMDAFASVCA